MSLFKTMWKGLMHAVVFNLGMLEISGIMGILNLAADDM